MAYRSPNPFHIIVLGSGVSGLSAAQAVLKCSRVPCKVTLLESEHRVGGWLQSTTYQDGSVFEHGPHSAKSSGNVALQTLNLVRLSLTINLK